MILLRLSGIRVKTARAVFRERDPEKILKFTIGLAVAAFFLTFGYWFFEYIFAYLEQLGDVGTLLMGKVLALTFFAALVLLLMSNLLTGISTIFRNSESAHLFTLPISYSEIFTLRAVDSFAYSTWAFAVLGMPLVVAYGHTAGYSWWYYPLIGALIFLPFVLIPAAVSSVVSMVYFRYARRINPMKFAMTVMAVLAAVLFAYVKSTTPENLSLYTYQDWRILNNYLSGMALSSSPMLPSSWVSVSLQEIAVGNFKGVAIYALALVSTCLLVWQAAILLSKRIFAAAWQRSYGTESAGAKRPVISGRMLAPLKWKILPMPGHLKNLLFKDTATFFRDATQWGQLTILIGLIMVYLFNLRFFPANMSDPFWKAVIAFANFAFCGFVLATLAVRFVFPIISLEGKALWALRAAPVSMSLVFWEKFMMAFLFFAGLAEVLAFVSSRMLGLPPLMALINHLGVLLISFSLTGLSVGMGAVFPNFAERNSSKIASGAGGMLAAVLSLVYVCVVVILAAYPTRLYIASITGGEQLNSKALIFSFAAIVIISLVTFAIPVSAGLRHLRRLEL